VITHIPIVCEDNKVPYIFVPSKEVRQAGGCTAARQGTGHSTAGRSSPGTWVSPCRHCVEQQVCIAGLKPVAVRMWGAVSLATAAVQQSGATCGLCLADAELVTVFAV